MKLVRRFSASAFVTLSAVIVAAFSSVSAAYAFDPIFGTPGPVPGPGVPFDQPPVPPFPPHPGGFLPGLPGVHLPGSGLHYGGMLPPVSTSSVDFDITEVDAPQATVRFGGGGVQVQVQVQQPLFDNNDGMGDGSQQALQADFQPQMDFSI